MKCFARKGSYQRCRLLANVGGLVSGPIRCYSGSSFTRDKKRGEMFISNEDISTPQQAIDLMDNESILSSSEESKNTSVNRVLASMYTNQEYSNETLAMKPSEEDYRALILDLLLYRKESLEPLLHGIQKERKVISEKLEQLSNATMQLESVREDIRLLLETSQEENLKSGRFILTNER